MTWDRLLEGLTVTTRDTFGRPVLFRRPGSGGFEVEIRAPFDPAHLFSDARQAVPVSWVAPMLDVRLADLPQAPQAGDECRINGLWYVVKNVMPLNDGCTKLHLHRKVAT